MAPVRQIALLLALAIATIALSLPSSAQAHDGRVHAAGSTSAHTPHGAAHAASSEIARAVPAMMAAGPHLDCTGDCCTAGGHHGSCCCATGLAPPAATAALPPVASVPSPIPEPVSPTGIAPKAPAEPPRPFA